MKVEQIYTGCLAHAAYYITHKNEAAIFDPLREVQPYINRASKDKAKIKYVFETHFHADFVSGHLDLQKKTGAEIIFGPNAKPGYEATIATDGQEFKVGDYRIKVLHTPGHTLESTTYLLIDENGNEHGLITGDTLFIGDVGRPDLAQSLSSDLTSEKLAGYLYDSLRTKIMPLPDHLIVYPSHGAGSACGKKMSKETSDTLGHQKKVNYALRANMSKEEFITEVLDGLSAPPPYFPQNVAMNIKGYESLDTVLERASTPFSVEDFEKAANDTLCVMLDTRDAADFAKGHIPNSINIGLNGNFAQWVGEMIPDVRQELLLITYNGKEKEALTRLSRVGYDQTIGFLKGGYQSWKNAGRPFGTVNRISATQLEQLAKKQKVKVIDVRNNTEFESGHVSDAIHVPLNQINSRLEKFPKEKLFAVHCAGGYRSMIAASLLKQRGWDNFVEIDGGYHTINQTDMAKASGSIEKA